MPAGDPAKGAQAILQLADMEAPPLRVPLGSDAVALIRQGYENGIAEIDRWETLSRSTDHDEAAPFDVSLVS